jgi:hypothetical protein
MTIQRKTRLLAVALVVLPLALAACGGRSEVGGGSSTEAGTTIFGGSGGIPAASCAMLVEYDGHNYLGAALEVTPEAGESLGTGTIPPCNDTGGAGTTIPAEEVEVTAVQGVPPSTAIMLAGRDDVVLVRDDVQKLPKELEPR